MDREKRRRALFETVMRLPEPERAAFIQRETLGDPTLRDAVLRLVSATAGDGAGVLDRPVFQRRQPHPSESPPSQIGAFTVVKHLGAGGMASVYACRRQDGRMVAVKLLHAGLCDADFLNRFEQERAIHSRIDHPNVCKILDGGTADHGTPFIVMELVEGQPIDRYCDRLKLPIGERLWLFSEVLAGVEFFHRKRIIHRDLKPANILVTAAGHVKILDFGIAKIATHSTGLTGNGPTGSALPLMTIRYASPEQLQKRLSGRSSDIYSLGVVLYELIAGQHPYSDVLEQGTQRLLAAMTSRTPARPSILKPAELLPGGVDDMLLKALQCDPAQRYRSAGQFLEQLRQCLDTQVMQRHSGRSV